MGEWRPHMNMHTCICTRARAHTHTHMHEHILIMKWANIKFGNKELELCGSQREEKIIRMSVSIENGVILVDL